MRHLINTCLLASLASSMCLGGGVHNVDFIPAVQDGKIVVGTVDLETGDVVYLSPIMSAVFGTEGFPNFTNNPGFNSELGALVPGMTIGFSILRAPRVWDDVAMDFETIASEQLTVRAAAQNFIAPSMDMRVDGIVFGQASSTPAASFHHHLQYLLNSGIPPVVEGVWLLELELWSESAGIEASEPLYVVFAQGEGEGQIDDAIAWIEENLIGSPCLADVNGDGTLSFFDVSAFLTAYIAQDLVADFNNDGQFNFFDVSAFLSAYANGCP